MDDQPNVLVLLTDQQRADTVEGDACLTPNLDRLADRGTRFSRCYSPNAVCSPARASLMTGELPHDHGVTHVTHTVPDHQCRFQDDLPTWGERLAAAGYDTGYVGKWHVDHGNDPGEHGFEFALGYGTERFERAFEEYRAENDLPSPPGSGASDGGDPDVDRYAPADGEVDDRGLDLSYTLRSEGYDDFTLYGTHDRPVEADRDHYAYTRGCEFVRDQASGDDPWCLTVSTFGPHDPYIVPREYYDRYDPAAIDPPPNYDDAMADRPELYRLQQSAFDGMDWRHVAEATACYYAYCTFLDEGVGRILDALAETGQREETVVVFASDHGDLLGAHRLFLKGMNAFEEAYRVPLVVDHPDGEGEDREDVVQSLDLAPTLCEVGGAAPMDCFATSLVPFLTGDRPEGHENEAYAECFGGRYLWTHRVVWGDRYKYVFNGGATDELYDLERDPAERDNLVGRPEYREVHERMAERMWEICEETGDETLANAHYPTLRYAPVGPAGRPTDGNAE
jgi:arylsulfatase A-like enzyme